MKARNIGRWRAAQVTRFYLSIANRDLHGSLWTWRDELAIDKCLLRERVEDRIRLALFAMSGEQ